MTASSITMSDASSLSNNIDFNSLTFVRLTLWIQTISLPIAFILGLFGNVMTIVIIRRFRTKRSALDHYFLCLAVTDLCVNVGGPLQRTITATTNFRPFGVHDVVCKVAFFVLNTSIRCSAWILVVMATHRAVSVVWPHRVNVVCTSKKSWGIVVGIIIFISMGHLHYLWGLKAIGGVCSFLNREYREFVVNVFLKILIFVSPVVPFICLMISNVVLVVNLRTSVKEVGDQFAATDKQRGERERKANSITVTTLAVSVSYIIFTLPVAIQNGVKFATAHTPQSTDIHDVAFRHFVHHVLLCFAYFNYSMNFYMYCLTGKRFRKEFLKCLLELFPCF